MRRKQVVLAGCLLAWVGSLVTSAQATAAAPPDQNQGPLEAVQGAPTPSPSAPEQDPVANLDQRLSTIEEWKAKIEKLPSLTDKFNVGINALQFL